jgi:hypothetical protein
VSVNLPIFTGTNERRHEEDHAELVSNALPLPTSPPGVAAVNVSIVGIGARVIWLDDDRLPAAILCRRPGPGRNVKIEVSVVAGPGVCREVLHTKVVGANHCTGSDGAKSNNDDESETESANNFLHA